MKHQSKRWVNVPGGGYIEFPRGLRCSALRDPNFPQLFRVTFCGVADTLTYEDVESAKHGAVHFANRVITEMLLVLLEIAEEPDDDNSDGGGAAFAAGA